MDSEQTHFTENETELIVIIKQISNPYLTGTNRASKSREKPDADKKWSQQTTPNLKTPHQWYKLRLSAKTSCDAWSLTPKLMQALWAKGRTLPKLESYPLSTIFIIASTIVASGMPEVSPWLVLSKSMYQPVVHKFVSFVFQPAAFTTSCDSKLRNFTAIERHTLFSVLIRYPATAIKCFLRIDCT